MTDKINEKVINIFTKHKKDPHCGEDENVIKNEDGFYYVCLTKDVNGHKFDEKKILDNVKELSYIIKIMVLHNNHPHIYSYKVTGDRISDFLMPYITGEKEGSVIEIDKYMHHDLA